MSMTDFPKRNATRVASKDGGILLSVHCDNPEWATLAKDILKRTSGQEVSSTNEAGPDFMKTDKPLRRAS